MGVLLRGARPAAAVLHRATGQGGGPEGLTACPFPWAAYLEMTARAFC